MRREKRKIIPLSPFAKHEFYKIREYDDILSLKDDLCPPELIHIWNYVFNMLDENNPAYAGLLI